MKRYTGLIVLLVGISCVSSHNQNETEYHHEGSLQRAQILPTNNLTVDTGVGQSKTINGEEFAQGRTFGIKRLQMMLLPLMYKMGVMTTLLVLLVALSLKGLMIGLLLLGLKIGSIIAKFHQHGSHQSHQPIWSPPPYPLQQPQPVHVHWHQDDHHASYGHHGLYDRQDQQAQNLVYQGWDQSSSPISYQKPVAIDNYGQYLYRG